jgi:hypothetical protein
MKIPGANMTLLWSLKCKVGHLELRGFFELRSICLSMSHRIFFLKKLINTVF